MFQPRSHWSTALAVDVVAFITVLLTPTPLVIVLLLYWIDSIGRVLRRALETGVAAPRSEYSPTGPPVTRPNGSPGPFRFLIPKVGTVRLTTWLPLSTPHNLRAAVPGVLLACLAGGGVGVTVSISQAPVLSHPSVWLVSVGIGVVVLRHGWAFRRFCRSDRRLGRETGRTVRLFWVMTGGLFVVLADNVYVGVESGIAAVFSLLAAVIVLGRVVYHWRRSYDHSEDTDTEPILLSEPDGQPTERFRVDRRATWVMGVIDGIAPRIDADVFNLWARFVGAFLPVVGVFWGVVVVGLSLPVALLIGGVVPAVAVSGAFVLSGVAHFELAFGAVEYRLYDEELVAYDTRLDAVQWRAPLAEIHDVSVADGWWLSPPGTDAGTVQLERSGMETTARPYGFVRQSLVCVADPERVADRLRRATVEKTRQEERSNDAGRVSSQQ